MSNPIRVPYWLLKIGMPLNLVLFPTTAIIGHFNPWPPASAALTQYSGQFPVLLGFGYNWHFEGSNSEETESRTYALFPSALQRPSTITITQINDTSPTVEESEHGLLFLAAWYAACIVGTWWFWFRRVAAQQGAPGDGPRPAGSARP